MEASQEQTQPQDERDRRIAELEAQLKERDQAQAAPKKQDDDEGRPWTVAAENGGDEHTRDEAPLPYRGPGSVRHHFPILTGGSGGNLNGPYVRALAELLAQAGYSNNDVIRGTSTVFDNSLKADVDRFTGEHDVKENTAAFGGHSRPAGEIVANLVGPYTVQALFEHVAEKTGEPVDELIARVERDVARSLTAHA